MARRILIAIFVSHAAFLVAALYGGGFKLDGDFTAAGLLALNAMAIAGVASRTRPGWFVALVFVAAASGHYTFDLGIEGAAWLPTVLGIAGAVLCMTDPDLRREHGIAA